MDTHTALNPVIPLGETSGPVENAEADDVEDIGDDEDDDDEALRECMVCSDQRREILFSPCGHITVCSQCSTRVKKCLLCREFVDDMKRVSGP